MTGRFAPEQRKGVVQADALPLPDSGACPAPSTGGAYVLYVAAFLFVLVYIKHELLELACICPVLQVIVIGATVL